MARKIAIDTDPGVDDVLAILLALASPEVDVALICPVFAAPGMETGSMGNAHVPQTTYNLRKLYHVLGMEFAANPAARERYPAVLNGHKTLVAVGENDPIGGEKHVAAYFHGKDGLSNITEEHPEFNPPDGDLRDENPFFQFTEKKAYQAILDLLRSEPENTVTVVALGPLTNLAWAYREDPVAFARIGEVVWMGGALDVPGNTSPVAEFNLFADPYAAELLFEAVKRGEFRLVFAPLDITTRHLIPFRELLHPALTNTGIDPKTVPPPTQLQAFVTSFLIRVRGLQAQFGLPDAMEMHDPVAIWYAVCHSPGLGACVPSTGLIEGEEGGWRIAGREFGVERSGELTRGMCVVDRRGDGSSAGTNRAENEKNNTSDLPVPQTRPEGLPKKDENIGRMGEKIEHCKDLPLQIHRSPGSRALRDILLARVFGVEPMRVDDELTS